MVEEPKEVTTPAISGEPPIVKFGEGLPASVPMPNEEETIQMMRVWFALSQYGDPVKVAEALPDLVEAAAEILIGYHFPALEAALAKLTSTKG